VSGRAERPIREVQRGNAKASKTFESEELHRNVSRPCRECRARKPGLSVVPDFGRNPNLPAGFEPSFLDVKVVNHFGVGGKDVPKASISSKRRSVSATQRRSFGPTWVAGLKRLSGKFSL